MTCALLLSLHKLKTLHETVQYCNYLINNSFAANPPTASQSTLTTTKILSSSTNSISTSAAPESTSSTNSSSTTKETSSSTTTMIQTETTSATTIQSTTTTTKSTTLTSADLSLCSNALWAVDSYCDDEMNNPECNYDGGACCEPEIIDDWCNFCICHEDGTRHPPVGGVGK